MIPIKKPIHLRLWPFLDMPHTIRGELSLCTTDGKITRTIDQVAEC